MTEQHFSMQLFSPNYFIFFSFNFFFYIWLNFHSNTSCSCIFCRVNTQKTTPKNLINENRTECQINRNTPNEQQTKKNNIQIKKRHSVWHKRIWKFDLIWLDCNVLKWKKKICLNFGILFWIIHEPSMKILKTEAT